MSTPTTRTTTPAGYMTSDCLSEEFSRRRVYITGEITDTMAANSGVSIQQIAVDCDRDYHLNAEESISYGLVDCIFSGFEE